MTIGLGVMVKEMTSDNSSSKAVLDAIGKIIKKAHIVDEEKLILTFTDGTGIEIVDGGQSCCEYRHMSTDDDLNDFEGAKLLDMELKDAPDIEEGYGIHEMQFLDVKTDKGVFQIVNHNEHNGYYGGFWIEASKLTN